MTSKSDHRAQMGLKMRAHAFVTVLERCANFHQNRTGSGTKSYFLSDFMTWNDPQAFALSLLDLWNRKICAHSHTNVIYELTVL